MYGSNNAVERRASKTSTNPMEQKGQDQDGAARSGSQVDTGHRELRTTAAKGLAETQGAAGSDMAGTGRGHCHPVMAAKGGRSGCSLSVGVPLVPPGVRTPQRTTHNRKSCHGPRGSSCNEIKALNKLRPQSSLSLP